ncbi:MAG TPA: flippase-like domain-containing protein, partial [Polyangiales bacterium]|nr:flippase-like domain-containing protein [Polyangiales bacterium]
MLVLVSPRVRDPLLQSCARIASRLLPSLREEVVLGHLREMLTVWDEVFRSPARFLGYFAVSLFAWSIEFAKLWVVLRCLGAPMDLVFAFFVYPASILAGLLSLLPISDAVVGVTGAVLMHTLAGVANGIATTAIVVDRTASVVPPLLLWGVFSFLRRRHAAT